MAGVCITVMMMMMTTMICSVAIKQKSEMETAQYEGINAI